MSRPFFKKCNNLLQRIHRLVVRELLEYAPNGWDTVLDDSEKGWSAAAVIDDERMKWDHYSRLLQRKGPLGFSHETCLDSEDDILLHNINYTFGYVIMRAAHGLDRFSVLDWGGGLGHYFLLAKTFLADDIHLDYHCRDMESLVKAGREFTPEITWYEDDSCLDRDYDLVMMSGSLQYCREWKGFLSKIRRSTRRYFFLTRTPVVRHAASFVAVQHAYGTKMLHLQFNEEELLQELQQLGFTLVREVALGDPVYIKNAPEDALLKGWIFSVQGNDTTLASR